MKLFCAGIGAAHPDIEDASRRMKAGEYKDCAANGVTDIMEVRIGYDGIVFASLNTGNAFEFTPADWFNALAAQIVVDGQVVANDRTNWNQVNPELADQEIMAFVPGTRHGTREVFEEKVIKQGCEDSGALEVFTAELGEEAAAEACVALRSDGRSVDIDGDYTETLARINKIGRAHV